MRKRVPSLSIDSEHQLRHTCDCSVSTVSQSGSKKRTGWTGYLLSSELMFTVSVQFPDAVISSGTFKPLQQFAEELVGPQCGAVADDD